MNQFRVFKKEDWLSRAEDIADDVLRVTRHSLPAIGRLLLVSTFLDDSLRLFTQWDTQVEFLRQNWTSSTILAHLWVAYMLLAQLVPSIMVLIRRAVPMACAVLLSAIIVQVVSYTVLWSPYFFSRNISVVGATVLLFSEAFHERPNLMAGLPRADDPGSEPRSLVLLVGRSLVIFMFASLIRMEMSFVKTVELAVGLVLVTLVTVGWKTKLCAMILFVWLFFVNLFVNCFWTVPLDKAHRDFIRYDFFQTLSVQGGLLLLISYGPGGVSLDDFKKRW